MTKSLVRLSTVCKAAIDVWLRSIIVALNINFDNVGIGYVRETKHPDLVILLCVERFVVFDRSPVALAVHNAPIYTDDKFEAIEVKVPQFQFEPAANSRSM